MQTGPAEQDVQVRGMIEDKSPKPTGLLPKSTQQLVILGVAVVMVLIMWLSGGKKRVNTPTTPPPTAGVQAPNAAAVEDFRQHLEEQQTASRQPVSEANLERLKALGLAGDAPPNGPGMPPTDSTVPQPGRVLGPQKRKLLPTPYEKTGKSVPICRSSHQT